MARLTVPPNYFGTSGPNLVTGEETSINPALPGIGIEVLPTGVINTRAGDDTVRGSGIGNGDGIGIGILVDEGGINGGDGHDFISGSTSSNGGVGIVIYSGNISGGDGDDTISGSNSSGGAGIFNDGGMISGGAGNDFISGSSPVSSNSAFGFAGLSNEQSSTIGGKAGIIDGGNGDDTISGSNIDGAGILNNGGNIRGGAGNDSIYGSATRESSRGIINYFGIDGLILGGYGNDTVTGYGNYIGIQGGKIDGGCGNDYFKARRIDAAGNPLAAAEQGGAVDNVLITGGKGCDTFDVGYGNATLNGGEGWDKLILLGSRDDYDWEGDMLA